MTHARFEALRIVLLGLGAAVLYGIAQDHVTARICPEYFTVGHADLGMPQVFHNPSPTVLAFAWGVVATWWVGLPLGVVLAVVGRAGRWPKLTAQDLLRPIGVVLGLMALGAVVGGFVGYFSGVVALVPAAVPEAARNRFAIDFGAHLAAYVVGLAGGLGLCVWTLLHRRRLSRAA